MYFFAAFNPTAFDLCQVSPTYFFVEDSYKVWLKGRQNTFENLAKVILSIYLFKETDVTSAFNWVRWKDI